MTRNHGDLLYPQAICDNPDALPLYRAVVRPLTRWERIVLAWRRLVNRVRD